MIKANYILDVKYFSCPLPLLKAKKKLNELHPFEILMVIATDIMAEKDFQAFAKQTGNRLLAIEKEDGEFRFFLEKKPN